MTLAARPWPVLASPGLAVWQSRWRGLVRAPRPGAALTTNGGRPEEELSQVGKLYGRRELGAKYGVFSSPDCRVTVGAFVWITKF